MKTIITTLFVFVLLTVDGQSKKKLLEEANDFKIEAIMASKYDAPESEIALEIERFLKTHNFSKNSDNPNDLLFLRKSKETKWKVKDRAPRKNIYPIDSDNQINLKVELRDRRIKPVNHDKLKHDGRANKAMISLSISGDERKNVSIIEEKSSMTSNKESISQINFKLKKHLYMKYVGDNIEMPQDLTSKIENYNKQQKREQNKLVAGIHY